ncbi:MAG: LysM peptidoglycan-binding domain-containing protein [Methylococcaceae bacterium]|nr:LysM peptidoglycan-binding domain-containing protein [Methylococcaceae bacterium]
MFVWKNCTLLFICYLFLISLTLNAAPRFWTFTLQSEDNLWNISLQYSHTRYWQQIQQLNNIPDPRKIAKGTTIKIPVEWLNLVTSEVKVVALQGHPIVIEKNRQTPLSVNMALKNGNTLRTHAQENALLQFVDGSKMLVKENSQLFFAELNTYAKTGITNTHVILQSGSVDNMVKPTKAKEGSHYQISTPTAIMAARGTQYRVNFSYAEKVASTEVLQGSISTQGANQTVLVPKNMGTVVRQGQAPIPPKPLLPPPNLSSLPQTINDSPANLSFSPLINATSYQIEIAKEQSFSTLIYSTRSTTPTLITPKLADGYYFVRIRGIDRDGLQGLDAIKGFNIDARLLPPTTISPTSTTVTRENSVASFKWTPPPRASAYHLQVSNSPNFQSLIINQARLLSPSFNIKTLPPNQYYWRVATLNSTGRSGDFSPPVAFIIKAIPKSPRVEKVEFKGENLYLLWRQQTVGQKYHFQIAQDQEFIVMISQTIVAQPSVGFSTLAAGIYYVRIATIDPDGYKGPFGAPQAINVPAWYDPIVKPFKGY